MSRASLSEHTCVAPVGAHWHGILAAMRGAIRPGNNSARNRTPLLLFVHETTQPGSPSDDALRGRAPVSGDQTPGVQAPWRRPTHRSSDGREKEDYLRAESAMTVPKHASVRHALPVPSHTR